MLEVDATGRAARMQGVRPVSAVTGEGLDAAVAAMSELLSAAALREELRLPFGEERRRAWLFERGVVEAERQEEDGYVLELRWSPRQKAQFRQL